MTRSRVSGRGVIDRDMIPNRVYATYARRYRLWGLSRDSFPEDRAVWSEEGNCPRALRILP
jgi:hypothetical protein